MSKIIAVVGAPGSGKTTVAFKAAQEIYCGTSDNRVLFLSPDSLVPSIAILFPNYSPDELYSLGKLFDSTDICTEDVLKNSVVTKTMKNFLCLGYKSGENRYSYPEPTQDKVLFERFKLGINNQATIKRAIEKSKQPPEKTRPEKSAEEKFIDELFRKPPQKEKTMTENPSVAKTEKSRPSEPISKTRNGQTETRDNSSRRSIKIELDEIKAEQRKSQGKSKTPKEQTKSQPKRNKSKKVKER